MPARAGSGTHGGGGRTCGLLALALIALAAPFSAAAEYDIRVANFSLHSATASSFRWDPLDKAVEKL